MHRLWAALLVLSFAATAQVRHRASSERPPRGILSIDVRSSRSHSLAQPRVLMMEGGRQRAASSGSSAGRAAREFLVGARSKSGLSADQAGQLKLLRESAPEAGGAGWADFQQTIGGVPVFEGLVKVALSPDGENAAVTLPGWLPWQLNGALAALSPRDAVSAALRATGLARGTSSELETIPSANADVAFRNPLSGGNDPILVDLVAFPISAESARLGWRIHLDGGPGRRAELVMDAMNGRTLFCESLEKSAGTGKVWRVAPDKGDRVTVPFPDGWLAGGQTQTTGNNADVYLDTDGDNQPDSLAEPNLRQGRAFAENQVFDFPAPVNDGSDDPRKFRAAAVVNAFYFANTAHDYFFGLGFDEAAGNFQRDNGSKPGLGGDPVRVEVQERFATNNAFMSLTRDGTSPRLELGIFTRGTPGLGDDRDFAYDGQTIIHEYTHGVTNRSVGGGASLTCLTGTQSKALDEGWADYFASSFFNDPVQSSFYASTTRGVRRRSYENYPYTFEDLGNEGFEEHNDGEIWAATLWDVRKAIGQQTADRLVYSALGRTACRPTFVTARDAILGADAILNKSANHPKLWEVFARHGLGASASGTDGQAGIGTVFTAAFDQPAELQPGNRNPSVTSQPPPFIAGREAFAYQIQATDPDGNALRYELTAGPAGMTVDPATGLVRWAAQFFGGRVKVVITDGQGGRVIHGFNLQVLTALRPGVTNSISVPLKGEAALVSIEVPENTPVLQVTSRGGTGDVDISLIGPKGEFEFSEPRSGAFETMSVGNPSPGVWIATLYAFRAFENAQITASLPVPRLLKGNDSVVGLGGDTSSETFFRVAVPQGGTGLTVTTSGGSGDVDLFVDRDIPPTCQAFDEAVSLLRCYYLRASTNFRNNERVQIDAPQAGNWYINLSSALGYGGVTLTTQLNVRPTLLLDPGTVTLNVLEGATTPVTRVIRISDPSGTKFDWTATVNPAAPWLKLSAEKGNGDADLTLTVSTAGLAPGTYRTSITVNGVGLGLTPQTVPVVLNYTRPPAIATSAAALNFSAPAGFTPPTQTLEISNAGSGAFEWSVTASTTSGGNWLFVDQPRGTGNTRLQVSVRAGTLAAGTYDGALTIAATGAPAVTVRVRYVVAVSVSLSDEGLRSLSSARLGRALSPGDLVVAPGSNLTTACSTAAGAATPCATASAYPLPTESGGLRILVNDIPAPLVYVSPDQARFIVPFEVTGSELRIVASRGPGAASAPILRALEPQSIGIFTVLDFGAGAGRIHHADGSLVSAAAPLAANETVTIQAGGLGAVDPAVANGAAAPADPLAMVQTPVQVYLDGVEAKVEAAYLEPGLAGIYRVRMVVPEGLPRKYPIVQVQSSTAQSQEVSAGGPSLGGINPPVAGRGADVVVTLSGINLPAAPVVRIGEESLTGEIVETAASGVQSLRVTIPSSLLPALASDIALTVADSAAPGEAPSNPITLRLR